MRFRPRFAAPSLAAPLLAALLTVCATPASRARAEEPPPQPVPAPPFEGAFLPKDDLRVPAFLAAHPEADGRGVVVAVLDTGVDPGHPRLARTPSGERKIVDLLDATDDGVVDTSTAVAPRDGVVLGLTGRVLRLGALVGAGETGTLGRIDAQDALPEDLVNRARAKRRERRDQALRAWKEAGAAATRATTKESPEDTDARAAREAKARDAFPDDAPAFDVLVIVGANGARVVIDTDGDGDLVEERVLRDYAVAGDWVRLRDDTELNVAVRPDADGRRVRLLFDGGGHGTHVAGIVAGYEGPGAALNGIAPGARILSIKIGNSRYGGATTNLSIVRALEWAGARGAKVMNMSFGGPSFAGDAETPDARAVDEAVERFGMTCCLSAGNEGPAFTTVGSPATARRALSVGAFVSPETMRSSYAAIGPSAGERLFWFSSRGPLPGGDLGVSVVAPGAAWSALPSWHLVRADNWNGTSMAAPQVAGAVALLLSGAAAKGVRATPADVGRALRSTARPVEGLHALEQGAGLVQVDAAFDALVRGASAPDDPPLRAVVSNATGVGGGIYVRDARAAGAFDRSVEVRPDWPRAARNEDREAYERRLVLASDAAYVEVPSRLALNADGNRFTARVDAHGLAPGLHVSRIRAFDPSRPGEPPVLEVPVTLVVPDALDARGRATAGIELAPGERASRFYAVPYGASRVRVRVRQEQGPKNAIQLAVGDLDQWRRPDDRAAVRRFTFEGDDEQEASLRVLPGTVVETVLFSQWSTNVPATLRLEVRFDGPVALDDAVEVAPGVDVGLLRLASPLGPFVGRVEAKITEVVERPRLETTVRADGDEAFLGGGRVFTAVRRFSVEVRDGEDVRVVPLGGAALDEQREDARWRVLDVAGRVRTREVIDGAFSLAGFPRGRYVVEYEAPAWGRDAADVGHTGFEVRRGRDEAGATVYPTADLAVEGRNASAALDLVVGATRSVAVRVPALPDGALYAGTVVVRDANGAEAFTVPFLVDRRTDAPTPPEAARTAWLDALATATGRVVDDPLATREDATAAAADARTLLRLRRDDAAVAPVAAQALALAATTAAERTEADEALATSVTRLDAAKPDDRAPRARCLLARAGLLTAAGAAAKGDAERAAALEREARTFLPEDDAAVRRLVLSRADASIAARRAALDAATALSEAAPADVRASRRVLEHLLALGWHLPAAVELRSWPTRFPGERTTFLDLAARVRAAGGDPAVRTLEGIVAGAP